MQKCREVERWTVTEKTKEGLLEKTDKKEKKKDIKNRKTMQVYKRKQWEEIGTRE